jgi:acyl carrier protein
VKREEIDATVRGVMSRVLGFEIGAGSDVSRTTHPVWDSLKHVELLFAIEDALGVRFDAAELPILDSVAKIVASGERHLAA